MKNQDELQAEKDELIKKYGKVRELDVPLDEDDATKKAVLFFKKPDKSTRSMIGMLAQKGDNNKIIEATLKALYIGGDDLNLVLNNDDAFASCDEALAQMLEVQKAVLKKN
jgi:hypothetical protein